MFGYIQQFVPATRLLVRGYNAWNGIHTETQRFESSTTGIFLDSSLTVLTPTYERRHDNGTEQFPLLILLHGFAETKDTWSVQVAEFVRNGFICFAYTGRGFNGSDGECALFSEPEIEDVDVAVREALRILPHGIDTTRLTVMGRSYGGGIALRACSRPSTPFIAAVLFSPLLSLQSLVRQDSIKLDILTALSLAKQLTGTRLDQRSEVFFRLVSDPQTDYFERITLFNAYLSTTDAVITTEASRVPLFLYLSGQDEIVCSRRAANDFVAFLRSSGSTEEPARSSTMHVTTGNHLIRESVSTPLLLSASTQYRISMDRLISWLLNKASIGKLYAEVNVGQGFHPIGRYLSVIGPVNYTVRVRTLALTQASNRFIPLSWTRFVGLTTFLNGWFLPSNVPPLQLLPLTRSFNAYVVSDAAWLSYVLFGFPRISFVLSTSQPKAAFVLYLVLYNTVGIGQIIGHVPVTCRTQQDHVAYSGIYFSYGAHQVHPGYRLALCMTKADLQYRPQQSIPSNYAVSLENIVIQFQNYYSASAGLEDHVWT